MNFTFFDEATRLGVTWQGNLVPTGDVRPQCLLAFALCFSSFDGAVERCPHRSLMSSPRPIK